MDPTSFPRIVSDSGFRFIPEPATTSSFSIVRDALRGVAQVASAISGGAGGIVSAIAPEMRGEFQDLIALQLEAQKQMMVVSMVSNIEKSRHETQMAAVRNIRVG